MAQEAAGAACRYVATRGGAALGAFAGGAAGTAFAGPAGTAAGGGIGSYLGGAAGAALSAAFCPEADPRAGDYPLVPGPPALGQCPVPYRIIYSYDQYNPDGSFKSGPFTGTINDVPGSSSAKLYGPISQPFTVEFSGTGVQNQYTYHLQDGTKKTGPVGGNTSGTTAFTQWDLIRLDGEPDDCGSDDIIFPEPGTDVPRLEDDPVARTPINVDIDYGNGVVIAVEGDLVLTGPRIEGDGLVLDFNFDGLDFSLFPDATINIGGGNKRPQNPDEPDTSNKLLGVYYQVTGISTAQSLDAVGSSTFFYPRFGAVKFLTATLETEYYPVASDNGYVENPAPAVFSSFEFYPYKPGNSADFTERREKV